MALGEPMTSSPVRLVLLPASNALGALKSCEDGNGLAIDLGPIPNDGLGHEQEVAGERISAVASGRPASAIVVQCASADPAIAARALSELFAECTRREIGLLVITIPPVGGRASIASFARYQDALNFAYLLLDELRFAAESSSARLALKAPSCGCFFSPVELRDLIDRVSSSAVGVCVDAQALTRFGSVQDWLSTLGYRVFAIWEPNNEGAGTSGASMVTLVRSSESGHGPS